MARAGDPTQIYLVATVVPGSDLMACLDEAISRTRAASVLLEFQAGGDVSTLLSVIERLQKRGVAVLIAGDARLARTVKADGVHFEPGKTIAEQFAEAREILGSGAIVGIDAGRSRHDAMTLGEAGTDYVGFGIPGHVEDRQTARSRRLDLISWWSEIFQIPCVAFDVETAEEAADLAQAGADFIAIRLPPGLNAAGIAATIDPFVAALAIHAPAD